MLTLKEIMEASDGELTDEVKQMLLANMWDWVVYIEGGRVGNEPKNILVNAYTIEEMELFAIHIVEDPLCKDAVIKDD